MHGSFHSRRVAQRRQKVMIALLILICPGSSSCRAASPSPRPSECHKVCTLGNISLKQENELYSLSRESSLSGTSSSSFHSHLNGENMAVNTSVNRTTDNSVLMGPTNRGCRCALCAARRMSGSFLTLRNDLDHSNLWVFNDCQHKLARQVDDEGALGG